jgi:hypothetical protein
MNAPMKFSVLSTRAANTDKQIRLGGKIRAGIKVLTKTAQANPKAVSIYNEGVEKRLKFTDIEKRIKDTTGIANPMFPRNTPFFNVAASDFGMPEIAAHIVDTYGEIRPEHSTKKQLYRFPVVFHSDDLNEVYPNQFKRHGFEPHYESHYGEDGERYCRYLPTVTDEQAAEIRARRIKKMPRREKVVRGRCDPGSCHEFGQGQCKFRGRLLFYVPGISTTGMLGMETSSEYAAEGIWSDLERIRDALGTIPRWNPNNPGAPIFWITKSLEPRTYFDEHGKKQNGFQWVPKLQADIDIGALLSSGKVMALPSAQTPVAWLSKPIGMPDAVLLPASDATPIQAEDHGAQQPGTVDVNAQLESLVDEMGLNRDTVMQYFDIKIAQSWENEPAHVITAIKMLEPLKRLGNECAAKLIGLSVRVTQLGIDSRDFNAYAFGLYGRGYTAKIDVLSRIEAEIEELAKLPREDAIAHVKKIHIAAQAA